MKESALVKTEVGVRDVGQFGQQGGAEFMFQATV